MLVINDPFFLPSGLKYKMISTGEEAAYSAVDKVLFLLLPCKQMAI